MIDSIHIGRAFHGKSGNIISWHGLWCPNCEKYQVSIAKPDSKYLINYSAKCPCGYSMDALGSDGSIRSAVVEWKLVCKAALKVKTQLLEASTMNGQLELNVTAFIGVTPWFDAAMQTPTHAGWYDVRYKMSDEEREARAPHSERRWWNVQHQSFGWPITLGDQPSPEEVERAQDRVATAPTSAFEWRGLAAQHPDLALRRR